MLIEATDKPIRYRLKTGEEVTLHPGVPTELPDVAAQRLIVKAAGKVRPVNPDPPIMIDPAGPIARPVYWERGTGEIFGPATVTHLAKTNAGPSERFWVIVEFQGSIAWVLADQLRSKRQFLEQRPLREIELIREVK